jgi:hypothetical protein
MTEVAADPTRRLRLGVYALLIALAAFFARKLRRPQAVPA